MGEATLFSPLCSTCIPAQWVMELRWITAWAEGEEGREVTESTSVCSEMTESAAHHEELKVSSGELTEACAETQVHAGAGSKEAQLLEH